MHYESEERESNEQSETPSPTTQKSSEVITALKVTFKIKDSVMAENLDTLWLFSERSRKRRQHRQR
jgi:SET domain-containing protein